MQRARGMLDNQAHLRDGLPKPDVDGMRLVGQALAPLERAKARLGELDHEYWGL